MSIAYDPPRMSRTVRSNGLPIGNIFTTQHGFYFSPLSIAGQPFEECHGKSLTELTETLEMQEEKNRAALRGFNPSAVKK